MTEPNGPDSVNYLDRRLARAVRPLCSLASKHTKCPEGYLEWHAWANRKSRTHRTERCPGCGLYMIWVKKKRRIQGGPATKL